MTVNHADGSGPPGLFAGSLGEDVGRRGLGGIDVSRRDAPHDDRVAALLPDHAAHELSGVRLELEREESARLTREDDPAGGDVSDDVSWDGTRLAFRHESRPLRLEAEQQGEASCSGENPGSLGGTERPPDLTGSV
jgi:hypothetical protein